MQTDVSLGPEFGCRAGGQGSRDLECDGWHTYDTSTVGKFHKMREEHRALGPGAGGHCGEVVRAAAAEQYQICGHGSGCLLNASLLFGRVLFGCLL